MNENNNDHVETRIVNETTFELIKNEKWSLCYYFIGCDYYLITLYAVAAVIGVIANIFVIIMICKYRAKSVTNYLMINLAIADLLIVTICIPKMIIDEISISWNYSEFLCKFMSCLQSTLITVSIYTVMVIGIDRCMAIKNPVWSFFILRNVYNYKSIILVITTIWLTLSFYYYFMLYPNTKLEVLKKFIVNKTTEYLEKNHTHSIERKNILSNISQFEYYMTYTCTTNFMSFSSEIHMTFISMDFILTTIIPCFVILLAYVTISFTLWKPPLSCSDREHASSQQSHSLRHNRKQIALKLLVLSVLYVLCWTPYNTISYIYYILRLLNFNLSPKMGQSVFKLGQYFQLFAFGNSILNPVIYIWITRRSR
ncbi:hypothetical protein PUN28_006587 [Cardiocondyla obscurior]|uniref:G-protein coupled receptors family 1 profile domain-containing protein n=1 Tax=Cardiocondyla obscurior TaxID=286306 RepID=A0AAW2GBC4_9HYME